ncbi:hypothetical protein ASD10_04485 [Aeromicrobium sp. Root472D3]|nr:hypothetical protein ASD10_04485 [Aeromicrobium sp. Root472D3]
MTEHDARPLEERVFDEISEQLEALDPGLAPAVAEGSSTPSESELDSRRLRLQADLATVKAHWRTADGVRGDGAGITSCRVCGQDQPCDTVKVLASDYNVR